MGFIERLGRTIFRMIPPETELIYQFCARYVDRFNGDNNSNPMANGENAFLRNISSGLGDGVVFDVGANVGDWASFVLAVNPKINLYCFEPSKATYDQLAQRQWPRNVRLNNLGMGETPGILELQVVGEGSALNSLYSRRGIDSAKPQKVENVTITTVDEYCLKNAIERIGLIKVDVEGHELAVFKGMRQLMAKGCVDIIQFEYGGCNLDSRTHLSDIWDLLERQGFKFHKLYPEGPRHIEKYQQSLETFKYSNWIAINQRHVSV